MNPCPITDEGGTKEYAYWNFGITDYDSLLRDTMPKCGTYLIDLEKDLLYYFDAKTYEWLWRTHEGVDLYGGERCVFMMSNPLIVIEDICTVTKWSEWSSDLENLRNLAESLATVFGLAGDDIIADVQPLITGPLRKNVDRMACPVDVAYLAADEAPVHLARCLRLPKRARYTPKEKGNHSAKLVKPREGEDLHHQCIPHVNGSDLSNSRMILMDTGATFDMMNRKLAESRMPKFIRKLIRPTDINTANGKTKVSSGIRIRSGPWDCITDAVLLDNLLI